MTQALITISLIGFIAGFIFSMPVAGPISVLVTSNALRGRQQYCIHAALGASIADLVYVFLAVLGITELYNLYRPIIPYFLIVGAVFLFFLGLKIARTNLNLTEQTRQDEAEKGTTKRNNGFVTGFALNFLNPTLFLGWLTSSFITISFVAYMGFNTGGLDRMLTRNVEEINKTNLADSKQLIATDYSFISKSQDTALAPSRTKANVYYPLIISGLYAFFLSLGSIFWFYLFSIFLVKYRTRIKVQYLNLIVNGLGIVLCGFGLILAIKSIGSFLA